MQIGPLRICEVVSAILIGIAGLMALTVVALAEEPEIEIFGEIELEGTLFAQDPQFAAQERDDVSVAGKVTFQAQWWDGDLTFRLTPFARLDLVDDKRTHFDVREAKFDLVADAWTVTVGLDTVFWGKTEAVHLVDIINQTDGVEDLDDEDRLGQPMVRVGYLTDYGEFSLFYLPYFRERTFAGPEGRLRLNPVVRGPALYDTSTEEWTPSFAARFSGTFDDVDLGVSAFHGIGRDPAFFFDGTNLRPYYERITQVGVDVQYTSDATLWKGEGIYRWGQRNAAFVEEDFLALTGGLEHTLYSVFETNADLGLITEYAWDSRGSAAATIFENDLILGARLALNDEADTSALLTGAVDLDDGAVALRLEAERRIAEDWKLGIEGQAFLNSTRTGPGGSFADDHYIRVKLTWFFGVE